MKRILVIINVVFLLASCVSSTKTNQKESSENNETSLNEEVKKETLKTDKTHYKTYVNERFNYSVEYPDYLIPQGESDSGDGQKFVNKESTIQMWIYRSFKMNIETGDSPTLEEAFSLDLKDKKVVDKLLKNNFYIIESIEDDKINLQYTKLINGDYYEMLFIYPKEEQVKMKMVFDYVINSFTLN